ncbi:phosphodiester glycosidase family protein [Peribacillus asahii]|uniref:phosphodiester glycosidase family protein n=1 Tax=Peribacillus asahii TaxID=228899 RepID=UPI00207A4BF8|nr:phosphodiester glycosidase family protein [Peribacillus asahii]USK61633.1 phosphodiester glycosidase family protein [Peribacillus asahii]
MNQAITSIVLRSLICTTIFLFISVPSSAFAQSTNQNELPLGISGLRETRFVQQLTPGVTYTSIKRGIPSFEEYYSVDMGFFSDLKKAKVTKQTLKKHGFDSFILLIYNERYNDLYKDVLGYVIKSGKFKTQSEAIQLKEELVEKGFSNVKVSYSGWEKRNITGPWSIHIVEIDRNLIHRMTASLALDTVQGRETVSSIAKRMNSLVTINGGYFIMHKHAGTPGDLIGISVVGGELNSEAINNRSAFVLGGRSTAAIAPVSTSLYIQSSKGAVRTIDGLNRTIGKIRGCGGRFDQQLRHNITCTNHNELVQYRPIYGTRTPVGKGTEVVLDSKGTAIKIRNSRGQAIPANGSIIAGIGEAAEWLKKHAVIGEKLMISTKVMSNQIPISLTKETHIVNGGPLLLKNQQYMIAAKKEGFAHSDKFFYKFGIKRNPRTLVGIKPNGNILLVVVDGRNEQVSVGLSFEESAILMKALGAQDALNLDGGGSTTMAINGKVVNHPSDAAGERAVGDAISLIMESNM